MKLYRFAKDGNPIAYVAAESIEDADKEIESHPKFEAAIVTGQDIHPLAIKAERGMAILKNIEDSFLAAIAKIPNPPETFALPV